MNKNVLITGGTGFFGRSFISYVREHDLPYTISVLSRGVNSAHNDSFFDGIDVIRGDVRDFDSDRKFDCIIHAATSVQAPVSDDEMESVTVNGTRNILKFAAKSGCGKFLYTSSGAVYGRFDAPRVEDDSCFPDTCYGKTKLLAENLCLDSDLDVVIARCYALSGKYLNKNIQYAIGNFVKDAMYGKDIIIKSDGNSVRSYLDQDDLVKAFIKLLESSKPKSVYNIGSDIPIKLKDLAYKVRSLLNVDIGVKILNNAPDSSYKSVYVPNIDKFKNDFGNIVVKPLDDSIIEMSMTR